MLAMAVLGCMAVFAAAPTVEVGKVELVHDGFKFTEGPTWTDKGLLFSDLGSDAIHHGDRKVYRQPSGKANGLAWDKQGRLIACEHENRRVSITHADGRIETLASHYEGKPFNSPNDLTLHSNGAIFFTDPGYGGHKSELGYFGVYRLDKDGKVTLLHKDMKAPNGITLSQDERTLFVADSEDHFIMAFDLDASGQASNPRRFADCGGPDGIKVGRQGELWVADADGVLVYDTATGARVLTVPVPEQAANIAFGGKDGSTLYITARKGLYKAEVTWGK